jgi:hypothetical protein
MHQKIHDQPTMNRASDRFQVAKNLHSIFDELERHGCRRSTLLRKLGKAERIDSTKILYNYTLPSDAELENVTDRVRKLTKKARKYLDLAEAAAVEMKEQRELIVLRLFQNTTYEVPDDISDEQIAYLQETSKLLTGIGDAAIKRYDLSSYGEILGSNKIGWDIDGSFGHFQCLPYSVWLDDRAPRHVSFLGYAPTVLLCRQWVGPRPSDAIAGQAFQIDFERNPDALTDYFAEQAPLPKKNCIDVRVDVESEIWFGLAPLQSNWRWEPVFEKRFRFEISGYGLKRQIRMRSYDAQMLFEARNGALRGEDKFGHRLIWLNYFLGFPATGDERGFIISVSPHSGEPESFSLSTSELTRELFEGRWLIALDRFDAKALDLDQDVSVRDGQFFYERVSLDSCAKYLRPVHNADDWRNFEGICRAVDLNSKLWPEDEQREAWFSNHPSEGWPLIHTVAPVGSIALAIEQNLLGPIESRLDTVLFETVEERIARARSYYDSVVNKRDQKLARLLTSWER